MATPKSSGPMLNEYGAEQYIPANALHVDSSYQRPTNSNRVRKIANAFDAELAGRLIVSIRPDGQYFVVDGQHRLAAMRLRKIALVPCIVYEGWTAEREAEIFRLVNTATKQPSHYERHRAGVRAGHKDSLDIEAIATEYGCVLTERHPSSGSRRHVAAILTCYKIYHSKYGGPDLLRRAFNILADSFGDKPHAFDSDLITGMAYFVWRASKEEIFDEEHLRQVLQLTSPVDIMSEAGGWMQIAKFKYGSISFVLHERYNKGKRTKKLATWTAIEWENAMATSKQRGARRFAQRFNQSPLPS